jgi:Hsp20/alpha crystallin family
MGLLGTLRCNWVALSRHQGQECIDGDHLVIRLSCQGWILIVTSTCRSTMASSPSRPSAKKAIGRKLQRGYRSEFRYGSFVRQVPLPAGTSAEVVSAAYNDGVLEIRLPKPTPEAASRRIQVQRG